MSANELAARRFRDNYFKQRASGYLGGATVLYSLQHDGMDCFKAFEDGPDKLIAWVLAVVFGRLANDQDERPVGADEAASIFVALDQPLVTCLDALIGRQPKPDPLPALIVLLSAFSKLQLSAYT